MGVVRKTSRFIGRHFFNVRAWSGYDHAKVATIDLFRACRRILTPQSETYRNETFQEAMTRLNVSKQDLALRFATYRRYFTLWLVPTVVLFLYTVYLLFVDGSIRGGIIGMLVTLLAGCRALRYYIWTYQIRQQRLGCSISEVLKSLWRKQ